MTFTPKTEKELALEMVWDAGVYDFEVVKADHMVSKSGNKMIAIELRVFDCNGRKQTVKDWLVESEHALCKMKLRHYCRATNSMDAYETGDLGNFPGAGAAGRVRLVIEDDDKYGARNRVKDYVSDGDSSTPKPKAKPEPRKSKRDLLAEANQTVTDAMVNDDAIPF